MNSIVLDTNVISEIIKPRPSQAVLRFFQDTPEHAMHLSILSLGELRKGVVMRRQTDTTGAEALLQWTDELESRFSSRILPVSIDTVKLWGEWSSHRSRAVVDTLIAATAAAHGMVLATRNLHDFNDLPVQIVNPWQHA